MLEMIEEIKELKDAIEEIRAYLKKNHHPYTSVVITDEQVVIQEIIYHEPLD